MPKPAEMDVPEMPKAPPMSPRMATRDEQCKSRCHCTQIGGTGCYTLDEDGCRDAHRGDGGNDEDGKEHCQNDAHDNRLKRSGSVDELTQSDGELFDDGIGDYPADTTRDKRG